MKRFLSSLTALVILLTWFAIPSLADGTKEDFVLESFSESFDSTLMSPNSNTGYALPTFESTTEHTEDGVGLKVNWEVTSTQNAKVHQMTPTAEWSTSTFAEKALEYEYLRLWLSNPTPNHVDLTIRLFSADTKVFFKGDNAIVTDSNGDRITVSTGNVTESGENSSIVIPAEFEGWIAYPISTEATEGARGRVNLENFSVVNQIEIDVRRTETSQSGLYYVLDNLTLSDSAYIPNSSASDSVTPPDPVQGTLMLENFTDYTDFSQIKPNDNTSIGYASPTFETTEIGTDEGTGLRVNWASDSTHSAFVHQMLMDADWAHTTFAQNASQYAYFRIWVNNPTFVQLQLTVRLYSAATKVYFRADLAHVSEKDGRAIEFEIGNATESGVNSSITIPSAFSGWVAYPIKLDAVVGARGRDSISDFSEVTDIEIDVRRPETKDQDSYYVLDNICLSSDNIGTPQSTDDGSNSDDVDNNEPIQTELKNVIVLLGDGMGQGIMNAARDKLGTNLKLDSMWYQNKSVDTNNIEGVLTDSSAGGTALSCGVRTLNGYTAVDKDGNTLENMVEFFSRAGKKTGIVTTSYLVDATPTAFGSHGMRGSYASLARGLFRNNISVLIGGGTNYFGGSIAYDGSTYTLLDYAKTIYGYEYIDTPEALQSFNGDKVLGLFGSNYMDYEAQRTDSQPSITELTEKAISLLENDDGFFLLVEGGNIDHAEHANDLDLAINEMIAFDNAVQTALDYLEEHPDTLVVVCADHSTGGLAKSGNSYYFTTNNHDTSKTVCFASGLGSRYFTDITESANVGQAVRKAALEVKSGENDKVPADKTELIKAIQTGQSLNKDDYTAASYAAVETALTKALQVEADNNLYIQLMADEATEALNSAISKLKLATVKVSAIIVDTDKTLNVGESFELNLQIVPMNATDKTVTFTSSNEAVATVDVNGNVTAVGAGSAIITAASVSNPEITAVCTVTVSKPASTTTPAVTNGTATVNGKTVLYVNGKAVTGTKVVTVSGKTYAVVGGYVKTGKIQVVKIGSKSYIVNKSGVVQKGSKNKLVKVGSKSYIVNKSGVVIKGKKNKLVKVGKKKYVVNKKGVVQKSKKSVKVGKKTYRTNKKGVATLKK